MSTLPEFEFASAKTVQQAIASGGAAAGSGGGAGGWPDAAFYAGGVDLLDLMKERVFEPKRLVNIKPGADALHFVKSEADGTTRIGPLVTLAEIAANADLHKAFPALTEACGRAATPQIRNMATIGGNLCQRPRCWYFRGEDFLCLKKGGDHCFARSGENRYHAVFTEGEPCVIVHPSAAAVALVALDASVKVVGGSGSNGSNGSNGSDGSNGKSGSSGARGERMVRLEEFFVRPKDDVHRENVLKPGELITEITIPAEARQWKSAYVKQREKQSYDWPLADVAVAAKMGAGGPGGKIEAVRIVLGSAAPVPWRAKAAEEFLAGKELTEENARKAAELSIKGAVPLSQNGYKLQIIPVIVRRTIMALG